MDNQTLVAIVTIALGGLAGFLTAIFTLGRYSQKVDDLRERMVTVEAEIKVDSKKIVECCTLIDERTTSGAALTKRKSPISLNEKGEEILKNSASDKFVLENQTELVQKIKDKTPKTAYDVQVAAREVVESLQNEERFIPFKTFVYKEGFPLEHIFIVMGIYLRDIALPLLGFTPEQVDQTDPTRKDAQTPKQ